MEGIWRMIWSLDVPPKVRMFAWRVVRGIIPTRHALARRHVKLDTILCVFCELEYETEEHVLRDCPRAKEFWAIGPLHGVIHRHAGTPSLIWLCGLLDELPREQADVFFVLLWTLWRQRNKKLWEGVEFDSRAVIGWACTYLAEFKKVHGIHKSNNHQEHTRWKCPPSGRLKMNVDGAFVADESKGGVGGIIRDEEGVGIAAFARPYKYAMSPFTMEMLALRDGLRLATQQGWYNLHIESDFILLISAMNERRGDLSENGTILADCLRLSDDLHVVSYVHINREANQVADRLASVACGRGIDDVWFNPMPVFIYDAILFDVRDIVARSICPMPPLEHPSDFTIINNMEEGALPVI